ncbi:MAG: hypothetical protein HZB20_12115, partial [Chloroflexi bacterium]|nr:hypothetical protein [Chloroflexota bacterium]
GHSFRFVAVLSRRVRLSEGMGAGNVLTAAAMARAVDALARFRRYCEAHGARIVAVATAAARDAVNCREFLAQARAAATRPRRRVQRKRRWVCSMRCGPRGSLGWAQRSASGYGRRRGCAPSAGRWITWTRGGTRRI